MNMKNKAIFISVLLLLSLGIAPAAANQGKVALIANTIDFGMNPDIISMFRNNNLQVDYFGVGDSGYTAYDYIIILGGPDSAEHTGDLSRRVLPESEHSNLRNGNYRFMYEENDFFKMRQRVFVLAGSDREYTKMAVDQYISDVISKISNQPIQKATYQTLTPSQLKQMVDRREDIYLIDLRIEEQFAQGHIQGAVNIPYNRLGVKMSSIPRDKKVVLYCNTENRATGGAQFLADRNFENIYAMTEGYSFYHALAR